MNVAINKIVNCLDNVNQEMVFSQAEKENFSETEDLLKEYEQISDKAKMIAHEIKNHISVINLYSKILEKRLENAIFDKETTDSVSNAVNSIKQSSYSISSFISELRSYASPLFIEKNLSKTIDDVIQLALPKAKEKGVALENYCDEKYRVHIDEIKFQSVILNLFFIKL